MKNTVKQPKPLTGKKIQSKPQDIIPITTASPADRALHPELLTTDLDFYLVNIKTKEELLFVLPPQKIAWTQAKELAESKILGYFTQPLYFKTASNSQVQFSLTLDGPSTEEILQKLVKFYRTTNQVYAFISKTRGSAELAKSYGNYVISQLEYNEGIRTSSGKIWQAVATVRLTEVPFFQLDLGQDISVPKTIVPTIGDKEPPLSDAPIQTNTLIQEDWLPPGTMVYKMGDQGKNYASLTAAYFPKNFKPSLEDSAAKTKAAKFFTSQGLVRYPKIIEDEFSAGGNNSTKKTKLSELPLASTGSTQWYKEQLNWDQLQKVHKNRSLDTGLTGEGACSYVVSPTNYVNKNQPVYCEVKCKIRTDLMDWSEPNGRVRKWMEVVVETQSGIWIFRHSNGLTGAVLDARRKYNSSQNPNNKGGNTSKAKTTIKGEK